MSFCVYKLFGNDILWLPILEARALNMTKPLVGQDESISILEKPIKCDTDANKGGNKNALHEKVWLLLLKIKSLKNFTFLLKVTGDKNVMAQKLNYMLSDRLILEHLSKRSQNIFRKIKNC